MSLTLTEGRSTERLSTALEELQKGFAGLPAGGTVQGLGSRLADALQKAYPGTEFGILWRRKDSSVWEPIGGIEIPGTEVLPDPPAAPSVWHSEQGDSRSPVWFCQPLADGSCTAIASDTRPARTQISSDDLVTMRLFGNLFASAYRDMVYRRTEKDLVFSLNHRVLQLTSLIDTGIEVSKLDHKVSPLNLALERATSLTNASRGSITVQKRDELLEEFSFPANTPKTKPTSSITSTFHYGGTNYTFSLIDKESRSGIQSFDETDQMLLDALARQAHASLENRFLHRQSLEKQRIEQDIAVAASIQKRILPSTLPTIEGYDMAGINIPSITVGGDYYDCIKLPDGRYALVVADVAGKGVPAALLVSSLHAYLSAYLESPISLVNLAEKLNRVICSASTDEKFITALIALLAPETGVIESLNAGHNPAYRVTTDGTVVELGAGGLPFGMLEEVPPYSVEQITLEPGERFLLYTDGIPEARNENHTLFEQHIPLGNFLVGRRSDSASEFLGNLITEIKRFTGDAPQSDDITALYLLRNR